MTDTDAKTVAAKAMTSFAEMRGQLLAYEGYRDVTYHRHAKRIDRADGVSFLCPGCARIKDRRKGVHTIVLWAVQRAFPGATIGENGRREEGWVAQPTAVSKKDLTRPLVRLRATSPADVTIEDNRGAALITGTCGWRGWIESGRIIEEEEDAGG